MARISFQELEKIRESERSRMALRPDRYRAKITVHMGTCGVAAGARDIFTQFQSLVWDQKTDHVLLTSSGCAGLCAKEPMITVEVMDQPPVKYVRLDKDKAQRIFDQHVIGGKPVEECALACGCEATAA